MHRRDRAEYGNSYVALVNGYCEDVGTNQPLI